MIRRLILMMGLFGCINFINAQSYEAIIEQEVVANNLDVSLFLMHTGTSSPILGDCSFTINYNKSALNSATLQSDGQWDVDNNSGYDDNIVTSNQSIGFVQFEVILLGSPTYQIPDTKTLLGIIRFNIMDHQQNSEVTWRTNGLGATEIFDSGDNNITGNGTFTSPGDFSLPVELVTFNAEVEIEEITLKWTTESEVNNLGFEIYRAFEDKGDYVLLASYDTNPDLIGQGNTSTRHEYSYVDKTVEPEKEYWYKLADVDYFGFKKFHEAISVSTPEAPPIPTTFQLYQNYPNPFNPSTTLHFEIPDKAFATVETSLIIYNTLGQIVRVLVRDKLEPGIYIEQWNGTTDGGNIAPSGVYFAVFISGDYTQTIKIILIR